MRLAELEKTLVERSLAALTVGDKLLVKTCRALPGDFNEALLKQLGAHAPAVYWNFAGGRATRTDDQVLLDAEWVLFVVTANAGGYAPRRSGDSQQIGAYGILECLLTNLHGTKIGDGTLRLLDTRNLFTGSLGKSGVCVYSATFSIRMIVERPDKGTELDDFETFNLDMDVNPFASSATHQAWANEQAGGVPPDSKDTVELNQ